MKRSEKTDFLKSGSALLIIISVNSSWVIIIITVDWRAFFNLDLKKLFNTINFLSAFNITNFLEHLGHVCLLKPENSRPHPPKQLLTSGCRLIFKFDEMKLLPKGKPVFLYSKSKSLLMCSKKPRESSIACSTI